MRCYNLPHLGLHCKCVEVFHYANLVNSNVVRAVRRRGNLNNGANYGPRYVEANNATSNGNWNYGAGLNPCVQSIPKQLVSMLQCLSRVPKGIKIPSDWNRLGRTSIASKASALRFAGVGEPKG